MYASYLGHREVCQLLILKGARVEDTNERGQTAVSSLTFSLFTWISLFDSSQLMLAASCGAIDVVSQFDQPSGFMLLIFLCPGQNPVGLLGRCQPSGPVRAKQFALRRVRTFYLFIN